MSTARKIDSPLVSLRLWQPTDGVDAVETGGPFLTSDSRLSDLFNDYFIPITLKLEPEEAVVDATAVGYAESIEWWVKLTGDPALKLIDDVLLVKFERQLRRATYRRGLAGQERPLSEFTVAKHLKNIRAVLFRAGPKNADPKRPCKGLLTETPHLVVSAPRLDLPKGKFAMKQARAVFAACDEMAAFSNVSQRGDGGPQSAAWWRAFIAVLYFTGLRLRTVLGLEWSMIEEDEEGPWLKVPKRIVFKTGKATIKYLRAEAFELLNKLPRTSALVFPWPHSLTHLRDRHTWLQQQAGMRQTFCLHAWKRTHVREVGRTGLDEAMTRAQRAGDHADRKTTEDHYCNLGPEVARAMEPLVEPRRLDCTIDPNQRSLF